MKRSDRPFKSMLDKALSRSRDSKYKNSEGKLSSAGYRLTNPRREVLRVFIEADGPLTISEVYDLTSKNIRIDRVSTYRIIDVFKKMGLIHSVGEAGFIFCSHAHEEVNDSHLYLVCDECADVQEIELPRSIYESITKKVSDSGKFKNKGPIQVSGLCLQCEELST